MPAARQQLQAPARRRRIDRFRQNATAAGDHGVGGENVGAGMAEHNRPSLLLGEAHGVDRRQLIGVRGFIDVGRVDTVGLQPDLAEQFEPTG